MQKKLDYLRAVAGKPQLHSTEFTQSLTLGRAGREERERGGGRGGGVRPACGVRAVLAKAVVERHACADFRARARHQATPGGEEPGEGTKQTVWAGGMSEAMLPFRHGLDARPVTAELLTTGH